MQTLRFPGASGIKIAATLIVALPFALLTVAKGSFKATLPTINMIDGQVKDIVQALFLD